MAHVDGICSTCGKQVPLFGGTVPQRHRGARSGGAICVGTVGTPVAAAVPPAPQAQSAPPARAQPSPSPTRPPSDEPGPVHYLGALVLIGLVLVLLFAVGSWLVSGAGDAPSFCDSLEAEFLDEDFDQGDAAAYQSECVE